MSFRGRLQRIPGSFRDLFRGPSNEVRGIRQHASEDPRSKFSGYSHAFSGDGRKELEDPGKSSKGGSPRGRPPRTGVSASGFQGWMWQASEYLLLVISRKEVGYLQEAVGFRTGSLKTVARVCVGIRRTCLQGNGSAHRGLWSVLGTSP